MSINLFDYFKSKSKNQESFNEDVVSDSKDSGLDNVPILQSEVATGDDNAINEPKDAGAEIAKPKRKRTKKEKSDQETDKAPKRKKRRSDS
jgi:hypothetical protein